MDSGPVRRMVHDVQDQGIDPVNGPLSQQCGKVSGKHLLRQKACPDPVVDVMTDIGHLIGNADDIPLQSCRLTGRSMVTKTVPALPGKVQSPSLLLPALHYPGALLAVLKSCTGHCSQSPLSRMTEGRMTQIMPQRYRLRQILVGPDCLGNGPCDL